MSVLSLVLACLVAAYKVHMLQAWSASRPSWLLSLLWSRCLVVRGQEGFRLNERLVAGFVAV